MHTNDLNPINSATHAGGDSPRATERTDPTSSRLAGEADTSTANIVMLLRILSSHPRHRDSRATKATWATYAAEALGIASALEAGMARNDEAYHQAFDEVWTVFLPIESGAPWGGFVNRSQIERLNKALRHLAACTPPRAITIPETTDHA